MEYPTARIPATLEGLKPEAQTQEICANPYCERPVGLVGVTVAGQGKICGSCFRQVKRGIIMDENRELQTVWRE